MKKVYVLAASVLLCLGISLTVLAGNRLLGNATKADSKIYVDTTAQIDDRCENPILEYDGRIYISMRDIATFFAYEVTWDEESRTASANKMLREPPAVETPETALVIAKAVAKGQFAEKLTEQTAYCVHKDTTDEEYYGAKYIIYVYFDNEKVDMEKAQADEVYAETNADAVMSIAADNGVVDILKR